LKLHEYGLIEADEMSPPARGRGLKLTGRNGKWAGCSRPPHGGVD